MDDPVLVKHMLQYLYGLDYIEEPGEYEPEKLEEDDTWSSFSNKKKAKSQRRRRDPFEAPTLLYEDLPIPSYDEEPTPEEATPSQLESDCSKRPSPGGNAILHTQMCALGDFYGIPSLRRVARRKFKLALDKLHDIDGIIEVFKFVCNPDFRSDIVLCDIMVDKIATNNHLLDERDVEDILKKDGQLALNIARLMRLK